MKLVISAIEQYRFSLVVITTVVLLGVFSFFTMPRSEDPQLSFAIDYVTIVYPGTSPLDMEELVVDPIEKAFNEIEGIKEIRTTIRDSLVTMRVEFQYGNDPDKKYDDLLSAIASIRNQLPQGISKLDIKKLSPNDVNILQVALVSSTSSYRTLKLHAERLEKRLQRINAVKNADTWAVVEQQVQVLFDFDRAQQYGVSLNDCYKALRGGAKNVTGGYVNVSDQRFTVKTSGIYSDLDAIRNTFVGVKNDQPIYIKDVATVTFTDIEPTYLGRFNGQRSLFITTTQNQGTNIYNVMEHLKLELNAFSKTLPSDIKAHIAFDQSIGVKRQLNSFFGNLLYGLLMVGLLVMFFLGVKNMLIVITVIPLSVFIGFGLLDQTGFGIEQMSIVGLIVALGLLVDNAIVVTENIARLKNNGHDSISAAKLGASQVSWPIISGTLTTILAFLPILLMQSSAGDFVRGLPAIVIYSLIASLFIALFFTPLFSIWLGKLKTFEVNGLVQGLSFGQKVLTHISQSPYHSLLMFTFKYIKTFLLLVFVIFIGSLYLFKSVGVSFFPQAENNRLLVNIKLPQNSNLSHTSKVVDKVEKLLQKMDNIKSFTSNIGRGNPRIYYAETPLAEMPNNAQIFVQFDADTPREFWDVVQNLKSAVNNFLGAEVTVKVFQQGTPIEAPIVIKLFGDDFDVLRKVSTDIENIIIRTPHTENVRNPISENKIELKLNILHHRASQLRVSIENIDETIKMSLVGGDVGNYRDSYGDDFRITLKSTKPQGATISSFDKINVKNDMGEFIPLKQVATLELVSVPAHVQHLDNQRSAKITAYVNESVNVEGVTIQVHEQLKNYSFPEGVTYSVGGERKVRGEAFLGFIKSIIISLFGIFTVLIFQFRSFRQTLIVFMSIPFALSGAIFSLYITGASFSFMAFLGIAGLIGIVINNAIILIDTANNNCQCGMNKLSACVSASQERLTPVLLTTLTTIVSLIPIAIEGSATWSPLAFVLIGGLLMSTIITLLLVPALYTFNFKNHKLFANKLPSLYREIDL